MKNYFDHPLISLKSETYLTLIIFLAPILYFLSGINLDIYAPSMPTISAYFQASIAATKNTITLSLLGWGAGAFVFGILIDTVGRRKILLFGMFFYVVTSMLAPFCRGIHELMLLRFLQSFFISSILGSRVIIIDLFSGKRFTVAMLYTTIGYGLGPIIGPFVGGLLQYYFNWQANFIVLTVMGAIIFVLLFCFIKESISERHPLRIMHVLKRSLVVLSHKQFMAGVVIAGITQFQLMLYPTLGPFIVERTLHQSVLVYGNSALLVGASYLVGSLINRLLLRYLSPIRLCDIGFVILLIGVAMSYAFMAMATMDLMTIMLPILITGISVGVIFPNVLGMNLKQFARAPGIAMAVQSALLLSISSAGVFAISHVHIIALYQLSAILLVLALLEIIVFFAFYRQIFLVVE